MMRQLMWLFVVFGMSAGASEPSVEKAASESLMNGFPPPVEQRVTRANFMLPPYNRWAFQHLRELQPTRAVNRGSLPVSPLVEAPLELGQLALSLADGRSLTLDAFLAESYTDSFIVLHKGAIVFERYMNGMTPSTPHQMFSATKSVVGTLLLSLIDEELVVGRQPVSHYLPELSESAFGDASVQQVLDMTNAIEFSEIYDDPNSEVWRYGYVFNVFPRPEGYTGPVSIYDYLSTLTKSGDHGLAFHYVTPNTDVLAWVASRVTGLSLSQLVEQQLWQWLGVEHDAYFWLDDAGTEMAGGGLNITARDAARFGQMILQGGRYNDRQVIASRVAAQILTPGNPDGFTENYPDDDWYGAVASAYRNQWWTFNNAHRAVSAIGVHGQYIYIDKKAELVIVKQSSSPDAEGGTNLVNDVDGPLLYQALAEYLLEMPPGQR